MFKTRLLVIIIINHELLPHYHYHLRKSYDSVQKKGKYLTSAPIFPKDLLYNCKYEIFHTCKYWRYNNTSVCDCELGLT